MIRFVSWLFKSIQKMYLLSMIDNDMHKRLCRDDVTFQSSSSWAWEASKHTQSHSLLCRLGSFLLYFIVVEWRHGIFRALSITFPWPPNLLFRSREKNFIPLSGDVEDTVLATPYAYYSTPCLKLIILREDPSCLGNVYHWVMKEQLAVMQIGEAWMRPR